MKKSIKTIIGFGTALVFLFGLLFVPPIQNFVYSKTMQYYSQCTETSITYGRHISVLGCIGSAPKVCKKETIQYPGPCKPQQD
jgi:hypothetical protein